MKRLLIIAAALCLPSCAALGPLAGMMMGSPAQVANTTTLDEKAAIAIESAYTAAATAGKVAFKAGLIAPSTDADVQRPAFCKLVLAELATVTDTGGRIAALDCRAYEAVQKTRRAYDAGNSSSYSAAGSEAVTLLRELVNLIKGAS